MTREMNYQGRNYIDWDFTNVMFSSIFLIMSLYISQKLNEPVYDVSVMKMLKNCQWKVFTFFYFQRSHIYFTLFTIKNIILQKFI